MVKEDGTFEELRPGKMEEQIEEKQGENAEAPAKPSENGQLTLNPLLKTEEKTSKGREGKSVLNKQEECETGVVSLKVLERYTNALGGLWVVMILLSCYAIIEVLRVSSSTWLSVWTDQSSPKDHGPGFYNLIYALSGFYWKVWIDRVFVEKVELIQPNEEMLFLEDAIGSTVA